MSIYKNFIKVVLLFSITFLITINNSLHNKTTKIKSVSSSATENIDDYVNKKGVTWYVFILAFLSGILVSFTPCIYPMIPITMGILQQYSQQSLLHNITAASIYVLGISLVYAALGYFSAITGNIFGSWLENPIFIGIIILLFLYLALSMFGFYNIKLPTFKTQNTSFNLKNSLLKVFLFGLLSGTISSPCLTPPLAALLAVVSKIGNPFAGFFILFSFALGMGIILIFIGTVSGGLSALPRGGEWLIKTKKIIGFTILFACVFFLEPLIGAYLTKIGYWTITILLGLYVTTTIISIFKKKENIQKE
jgi:thioredoxin:protein disulfide reductase